MVSPSFLFPFCVSDSIFRALLEFFSQMEIVLGVSVERITSSQRAQITISWVALWFYQRILRETMFWILQMKLKFDPIFKIKKYNLWEKYFHLHLRVHYFILIFSSLRQNALTWTWTCIQPSIAVWIRTVIVLLNTGQLFES